MHLNEASDSSTETVVAKQCFQIASGVFEDEGDQLDVNYADIELFSSK